MPSFCLKFFPHLFNRIIICLLMPISWHNNQQCLLSSQKYLFMYKLYGHCHKGFPGLTSFSAFLSRPTSSQSYLAIDTLVPINCLLCMCTWSPHPYFCPTFSSSSYLFIMKNKNNTLVLIFHWVLPTNPPYFRKTTLSLIFLSLLD